MKRGVFLIGFLFLLYSCTSSPGPGGNPAAPPAPLAELPSALRFPESVSISVDRLGGGDAASFKFLMVGDDVSAEVEGIRVAVFLLSKIVDDILAPLHQLIIPVGAEVRNFTDLIFVKSRMLPIRIDFADFDEDGDGFLEGCSGHTAGLPICFRIWVDGERYLSGVFTAFPTVENPGAGRFKGFASLEFRDGFSAAVYDHQDPLNKSTEFFFSEFTDDGSGGFKLGERAHALLNQIGPDESAKKTANLNDTKEDGRFTNQIGQFFEDEDSLRMTSQSGPPSDRDFTNECISLDSFLIVEPMACDALLLNVDGIPFLEPVKLEDVIFPEDFPETPTF